MALGPSGSSKRGSFELTPASLGEFEADSAPSLSKRKRFEEGSSLATLRWPVQALLG